ncbi:hypothetical protein B0H11DRAFT_2027231 [Mycena galericulata]|nr:hypothetical protein B0H11DRAFT_2127081 [Mycena galericulata]KAJ7433199.1 hypothetical protein B0H11DRAFT_2122521 [Mycena galericulata]KAJ7479385.1 hypothetical protein B0H11DRAFT_2027231 [Mycena galericulata]
MHSHLPCRDHCCPGRDDPPAVPSTDIMSGTPVSAQDAASMYSIASSRMFTRSRCSDKHDLSYGENSSCKLSLSLEVANATGVGAGPRAGETLQRVRSTAPRSRHGFCTGCSPKSLRTPVLSTLLLVAPPPSSTSLICPSLTNVYHLFASFIPLPIRVTSFCSDFPCRFDHYTYC